MSKNILKLKLKTRKFEENNFGTQAWKTLFLELPDSWAQKKQNDNWMCKKSFESITTHTYIYICMLPYVYAVELKTGPRIASSVLKTGPRVMSKLVQYFTAFPILLCFGGMFNNTNSVTLCQNSVFAKFKEIPFLLLSFYVGDRETKNKNNKWKKNKKKTYKNRDFKVVIQKWKNEKWIFSKNCLTRFVSGRMRKTHIFVHTICFGQKKFWNSANQETQ